MQFYFNNFPNPFKFNEIANAVWVEKKFVHEGIACVIHDSHLDYNEHIFNAIEEYYELNKTNPLILSLLDNKLKALIANGKSLIETNCINSNPVKINTLRPTF